MTPDWEEVRRNNYAVNSEHSLYLPDYMCADFQRTLFDIRSLPETWQCPQEEKV